MSASTRSSRALPSYMKMGRKDLAEKALFDTANRRAAYARYLMASRAWDVFHITFTAPDNSHHFFWKDMDPAHPEYNPVDAVRYGDTIERVYRRMDEIIGELTALAPDAAVMLMSDHGGGFNQRGRGVSQRLAGQHRPAALSGRATASGEGRDQGADQTSRLGAGQMGLQSGRPHLPREAKLKLVKLLPGVRERMEMALTFGNIDWSRTKAYAYGARDDLWINLQGREPGGIVSPSEYEALRDEIIDKLHASRDVLDHQPVLEEAIKREQVYHGPNAAQVARHPDPLENDPGHSWHLPAAAGVSHHRCPPLSPNLNNGGHRLHGIFVMAGEGVRHGHASTRAFSGIWRPPSCTTWACRYPTTWTAACWPRASTRPGWTEHPVGFSEGAGESRPGRGLRQRRAGADRRTAARVGVRRLASYSSSSSYSYSTFR